MRPQTSERRINVNLIGANKLFYAFDSTLPTFEGHGEGDGAVDGDDKTNGSCNITDSGANVVTVVPPLILSTLKPPPPTLPQQQQQQPQNEQTQEQVLMEKFNGKLPIIANELNCTIAELRIRLGGGAEATTPPTTPDKPGPALQTQQQIIEESTIIQKLLRLTRRISPTVTLLDVIQERRERCLLLLGGSGAAAAATVNGAINDATANATGGTSAIESYALNFLSEAPTMPEILGIATVQPSTSSTRSTTTSTSASGSGMSQSKKKKKKKASTAGPPAPQDTLSSSDYDGDGDENYSSASSRRNLKRRLQRKEKRDKRMMLSEHGSNFSGGIASLTTPTILTGTSTETTQVPPRRKSTPKPEYIDTWARGEYFSMLKPNMSKMVDRILYERFQMLPRPQVPTFAVCAELEKLRLLLVDMITKQRARGVTVGTFSAVGSVSDGRSGGGGDGDGHSDDDDDDDRAKPIFKINSPAATSEDSSDGVVGNIIGSDGLMENDDDDDDDDDKGKEDDQREQLKNDQEYEKEAKEPKEPKLTKKEEEEKQQEDPTPTPPKRRVGSRRR